MRVGLVRSDSRAMSSARWSPRTLSGDATASEEAQRHHNPMAVQFTAVFRSVPGGYVAYVVALVLEANRALAREDAVSIEVIRKPIQLTA